MTPLKALAVQCNLSLKDTAAFLRIPETTVKSYWIGTRTGGGRHGKPSAQLQTAIKRLNTLARHIDSLSGQLLMEIVRMAPQKPSNLCQIILATHATPEAVRPLGLPFPDVYGAVLSRVMAGLPPELAVLVVFDPAATDDLEIR